jgi:hypothetical protein
MPPIDSYRQTGMISADVPSAPTHRQAGKTHCGACRFLGLAKPPTKSKQTANFVPPFGCRPQLAEEGQRSHDFPGNRVPIALGSGLIVVSRAGIAIGVLAIGRSRWTPDGQPATCIAALSGRGRLTADRVDSVIGVCSRMFYDSLFHFADQLLILSRLRVPQHGEGIPAAPMGGGHRQCTFQPARRAQTPILRSLRQARHPRRSTHSLDNLNLL